MRIAFSSTQEEEKNGVTPCFAFTEVVWRPVDVESGKKFTKSSAKAPDSRHFFPLQFARHFSA
jgi:hypothetical protein